MFKKIDLLFMERKLDELQNIYQSVPKGARPTIFQTLDERKKEYDLDRRKGRLSYL